MAISVYEVITDRVVTMLEAGNLPPWTKGWAGVGTPKNLVSGKDYRGINILLLAGQAYTSPYWATFNQVKDKGGQVRRGEKSTPVIFWKILEKNDEKKFILRYYNVFNVGQCDGLKVPAVETNEVVEPIQACVDLVKLYKDIPSMDIGGDRAYYNPSFDRLGMPLMSSFHSAEEYYSTLFHELVHSTGHETRLNRDGVTNPIRFGSHDYSFEELVAECGSAFLCGKVGIENKVIENQAAYIASWIKRLKSEPKWLIEAAGKAAKAADYIQGIKATKHETEEKEEE